MKIELKELKQALRWIEDNSNEYKVDIMVMDTHILIKSFDRAGLGVTIKIYREGLQDLPKLTRTETLKIV